MVSYFRHFKSIPLFSSKKKTIYKDQDCLDCSKSSHTLTSKETSKSLETLLHQNKKKMKFFIPLIVALSASGAIAQQVNDGTTTTTTGVSTIFSSTTVDVGAGGSTSTADTSTSVTTETVSATAVVANSTVVTNTSTDVLVVPTTVATSTVTSIVATSTTVSTSTASASATVVVNSNATTDHHVDVGSNSGASKIAMSAFPLFVVGAAAVLVF